jgi:hypothetical protein
VRSKLQVTRRFARAGICLNLTLFSLGALGNFHSLTFTLLDYPASAAVLQTFSRIAWQEGVISFGANSTWHRCSFAMSASVGAGPLTHLCSDLLHYRLNKIRRLRADLRRGSGTSNARRLLPLATGLNKRAESAIEHAAARASYRSSFESLGRARRRARAGWSGGGDGPCLGRSTPLAQSEQPVRVPMLQCAKFRRCG